MNEEERKNENKLIKQMIKLSVMRLRQANELKPGRGEVIH